MTVLLSQVMLKFCFKFNSFYSSLKYIFKNSYLCVGLKKSSLQIMLGAVVVVSNKSKNHNNFY